MKRTQIYLDELQDEQLADRASELGRTKSALIREAVDDYLIRASLDPTERTRRWRAALRASAGTITRLPEGTDFVTELRSGDAERHAELERRWRR